VAAVVGCVVTFSVVFMALVIAIEYLMFRQVSMCRTAVNNYLRQGGNIFAGLCLSVFLCVSKITQKVMDGSF